MSKKESAKIFTFAKVVAMSWGIATARGGMVAFGGGYDTRIQDAANERVLNRRRGKQKPKKQPLERTTPLGVIRLVK